MDSLMTAQDFIPWTVRNSLCILIITDDPALPAALDDLLQDGAAVVKIVRAAAEMPAALEGDHFDVAIVDAREDPLGATDVCARLRATAATADTPFLAVIAPELPPPLFDAVGAAADDMIEAPLSGPVSGPLLAVRLRLLSRLVRRDRQARALTPAALALNHAPVAIVAVDPLGTISYANGAATALLAPFGQHEHSANFMTLLAAESGASWVALVGDLLAGRIRRGRTCLTLLHPTGEPRAFQVDAVATIWGDHPGIMLALHDVTAAHRLRHEQEQEKQSLQNLNTSIVTSGLMERRLWAETLFDEIGVPLTALQDKLEQTKRTKGLGQTLDHIIGAVQELQQHLAPLRSIEHGLTAQLAAVLAALEEDGIATTLDADSAALELCPNVAHAIYGGARRLLHAPDLRRCLTSASIYLWCEGAVLYVHIEYGVKRDSAGLPGANADAVDRPGTSAWDDVVALGGEITQTGDDSQQALTISMVLDQVARK